MLFVHSFSPIEISLSLKLMASTPLTQLDGRTIRNAAQLERLANFSQHKTLLYSFQQLNFYQHLPSFQQEVTMISLLCDFAVTHQIEQIILLTHPGAYFNSNNLFLQHKGIIEQLVTRTGIPSLILSVQGIENRQARQHNLHHLFYHATSNTYHIPRRQGSIIYSIQLNTLAAIIEIGIRKQIAGKYDVFDTISTLSKFMQLSSGDKSIYQFHPLYLYYLSFRGKYVSTSMLELFLVNPNPMYAFRTEKEFGMQLFDANNLPEPQQWSPISEIDPLKQISIA
jgi:hypothetical protein